MDLSVNPQTHRQVDGKTDKWKDRILKFDTRPSSETGGGGEGGLLQVEMAQMGLRRGEISSLCKRTSKMAVSCLCARIAPLPPLPFFPSLPRSLFSLTCKWQKDSEVTSDTPSSLLLCWGGGEGPDNCYGNGMSLGSVDGLIRAASSPDESFDPPFRLFRSCTCRVLPCM